MGLEMVTVHNCLIRAINSIYLQCVNVERSPASIPAFIKYASVWGRVLNLHHTTEEKWIFPEIEEITEEKGIMDASVQQHHAFEEAVKAYTDYLNNADTGEEKYDGTKLKTIIDSFMPSLGQHLRDEILTLKGFDKYKDKTDWAKWTKGTIAKVVKKTQTADGMVSAPFAFDYPPCPPFVAGARSSPFGIPKQWILTINCMILGCGAALWGS